MYTIGMVLKRLSSEAESQNIYKVCECENGPIAWLVNFFNNP